MVVSLQSFSRNPFLGNGMKTLKYLIININSSNYYIYEEILYSPAGISLKPWAECQ